METEVIRASIVPARVAGWLWATLFLLLVAHTLGLVVTYGLGYSHALGFVPLFNIATEANVPTFFASALLMTSGMLFLLLWRIGKSRDRDSRVWLLLSAIFAFLALDEVAMIHEKFIEPVRAALGTGGVLYFAWIVPYATAVAVIGLFTAPAVRRLGPRFIKLFCTAAALYLGGAIGVEMIGGNYYEANAAIVDLKYRLVQTVEETLEFSGVIVLVYTLLVLISTRSPVTRFQVELSTRNGGSGSRDAIRAVPDRRVAL
jgi:hypothetical protein